MKKLIIQILKRLGYKLTKSSKSDGLNNEYGFKSKNQWIINYKINTILDIGANKGQFAGRFRILFSHAMIYSFEPIPEVYDQLCKRFEFDVKFKAFNIGLGKESGSIDFFQNDFTDSSSVLPMKKLHKESFPMTSNERKIKIMIDSLDEIMNPITILNPVLIKIDVQGFEEMVILGGEKTLKNASIIIVEVSFYELYENQVYFKTIFNHMERLGFTYKGNLEQLISPVDGCVLQADAIFIK